MKKCILEGIQDKHLAYYTFSRGESSRELKYAQHLARQGIARGLMVKIVSKPIAK